MILSSSFSRNFQSCLGSNPAAYRHNTFSKIWAVPWIADNCAFPKIFGRLNFPYQAFAFPEIVPSGKITVGFTVTLVALWILFISWARSWYFSTFSASVVRIFWSAWHSNDGKCLFLCVFEYYSNIGRLCFSHLSDKIVISQVILTSLLFSTACKRWWSYHLSIHCNS